MERVNSLAPKLRCDEKLVWDSQTFALIARDLEDSFRFLRVTHMKKRVHALLEYPPTPATLFTTPAQGPKENRKRPSPFPTKP